MTHDTNHQNTKGHNQAKEKTLAWLEKKKIQKDERHHSQKDTKKDTNKRHEKRTQKKTRNKYTKKGHKKRTRKWNFSNSKLLSIFN